MIIQLRVNVLACFLPLKPHFPKNLNILEYNGNLVFKSEQAQQRRAKVVTVTFQSTVPYQHGFISWQPVLNDRPQIFPGMPLIPSLISSVLDLWLLVQVVN